MTMTTTLPDTDVQVKQSNKMERYLVFAGSFYYPSGGWGDYRGSRDTLDRTKGLAFRTKEDWWQVVEASTGEIVSYSDES